MLVIWGLAMVILVLLHDIGSSLMFYGGLLAMLYVATGRLSFVVVGLSRSRSARGTWARTSPTSTIASRRGCIRSTPRLYNKTGGSYQLANSIFAQAAGGMFGQGFGQAVLTLPDGGDAAPRAADRHDLRGHHRRARAVRALRRVLLTYLLFIARGFKAAMLARDSFSTLLAAGLSAVFALQVFVIVGGVTRVIPLTGVTLPFISYGGSSIVANFVLLALLLLVSDRARRPVGMNAPICALFGLIVVLFALLIVWTTRWTRDRRQGAREQPAQRPHAARRS